MDKLVIIANNLKSEFRRYFMFKPSMKPYVKQIFIRNYGGKVSIYIPEQIYNYAFFYDESLVEKCVQRAIDRYAFENNKKGVIL
ncbi:MAG: hypothetical protein IKF82_01250 [Bacilli bacterium]|nr:hypothetical protein [Bacilli bacterium]